MGLIISLSNHFSMECSSDYLKKNILILYHFLNDATFDYLKKKKKKTNKQSIKLLFTFRIESIHHRLIYQLLWYATPTWQNPFRGDYQMNSWSWNENTTGKSLSISRFFKWYILHLWNYCKINVYFWGGYSA
jgi:hypothetical protein